MQGDEDEVVITRVIEGRHDIRYLLPEAIAFIHAPTRDQIFYGERDWKTRYIQNVTDDGYFSEVKVEYNSEEERDPWWAEHCPGYRYE